MAYLKFIKKRNRLENSTGNLVIYPDHVATSYGWWDLGKYIDGIGFIVNIYRYSMTTGRHIKEYESYLRSKGISYRTINVNSSRITREVVVEELGADTIARLAVSEVIHEA